MTFDESEPDDTGLVLGPDPGSLILRMVNGDDWGASLVLEGENGDAVAWPVAPVLELPGLTVMATLGKDLDDDPDDSLAAWEMTAAQVAAVGHDAKVRLACDGETWWMGRTSCRS